MKYLTDGKKTMPSTQLIYAPTDPVYRVPDLAINPKQLSERAMERFHSFRMDRIDWLMKREEFYLGWDDYLSPIRKGPWEDASNIHLPMTEIQCNALHARLMQAFFGLENWFYVDPQEDLDMERIKKIELKMKYILTRYCNYHKGIYLAIDDWCWDLVTEGMGILSRDWKILQRRFIKVVENDQFKKQKLDLQRLMEDDVDVDEFEAAAKNLKKYPYQEKEIIRTVFNGPVVIAENPIYILFQGDVVDATDLDNQETILKVCYFSKDDLLGFKQSDFMDEDVVDAILETPPDRKGSTIGTMDGSRIEQTKDAIIGVKTQNSNVVRDEWEFLCAWDRVSLEVSDNKRKHSLSDELVYFVHTGTEKLARWTFLDRIHEDGRRGLHMAHLYRRPRRSVGRGMIETQTPMNDIADLLINQSIDSGLLANQPMFGYRSNSTFDPKEVRVQPGLGLKMDDPNNDIRFFNWSVNTAWSAPIQGLIQSMSQQLTGIGPSALGQVGNNVGATRSNSGLNTLLAETGTLLDVIIKRAKIPYSEMLEGLYLDCVERMPDNLVITVTGGDGEPEMDEEGNILRVEVTQDELRARVHFGLYANSQNMNRPAQEAAAMKMAQFYLQRVFLETGVVQPQNIYEIGVHLAKAMSVPRSYKFLTAPKTQLAIPLEAEILMIMQGIPPHIVLGDSEHEKKIAYMSQLLDSEAAQLEAKFGMVSPNAMKLLEAAIQKHQRYLETIQQPTNLQNPTGMQSNPNVSAPNAQSNPQEQGSEQRAQNEQNPNPEGQ